MELSGRPGGGGIGRPVELSGGRFDGVEPSPASPDVGRCVGRIVVGPSGDAVRVGTGLGTATRLRTTLGAAASTDSTTGGDSTEGAAGVATASRTGATTRDTRVDTVGSTSFFVLVDTASTGAAGFVDLMALADSSG